MWSYSFPISPLELFITVIVISSYTLVLSSSFQILENSYNRNTTLANYSINRVIECSIFSKNPNGRKTSVSRAGISNLQMMRISNRCNIPSKLFIRPPVYA